MSQNVFASYMGSISCKTVEARELGKNNLLGAVSRLLLLIEMNNNPVEEFLFAKRIYINDNKELYEKYKKNKELIEKELNQKLEWRMATKDCRILAKRVGDIKKGEEVWHDMFEWFIDMSLKLRDIIKKYGV